jgi:hypothetical protein
MLYTSPFHCHDASSKDEEFEVGPCEMHARHETIETLSCASNDHGVGHAGPDWTLTYEVTPPRRRIGQRMAHQTNGKEPCGGVPLADSDGLRYAARR